MYPKNYSRTCITLLFHESTKCNVDFREVCGKENFHEYFPTNDAYKIQDYNLLKLRKVENPNETIIPPFVNYLQATGKEVNNENLGKLMNKYYGKTN